VSRYLLDTNIISNVTKPVPSEPLLAWMAAHDMIIAAVAESNGCLIVTDNERDFVGLRILNPLRA
jgi:predicted nucleic acid-binding protein